MVKIKKKYKFAVLAADVVIFTVKNQKLQVLLIKMKKHPFEDFWAAPGGLVKPDETLRKAAKRHLLVKAGVKDIFLEQLYTFGKVDRDPFGRVVSVAYFALIPSEGLELKTTPEYANVKWFSVGHLPKLAYDHLEIINYAILRLQEKLEHSNIVYGLMPSKFTLSELQKTYEIILKKKLDKRNFRKKLFALGLVKGINKTKMAGACRPAKLYRFAKRSPQRVKIL
jgi:8-oxo-dGTP diphosphatase